MHDVPETAAPMSARRRPRGALAYRWVRQLHLWIGAWGALAAVLYGFTGLVMNHRFGDGAWPQGDSAERGRMVVAVPQDARGTPDALSAWLAREHGLQAQVIRKSKPEGGALGRQPVEQVPRWTLSGGTAAEAWSLEYAPGNATADVKHTHHSPLAAFNRLHKGVGGGWAWTLLADSFAIGMVLLGLSGLWMWVRGRSPMQMAMSVLALSTAIGAVVVGLAVA